MSEVITFGGRMMSMATKVAAMAPWRDTMERWTCSLGHKFPTSRVVLSFCRHFAGQLADQEGDQFERLVTFSTGGKMRCGGIGKLGAISAQYYFVGSITGQDEDERHLAELMSRAVRDGDTFFDIGASLGFYSFFLGPLCGLKGAVHSFEANPTLIRHLRASAELNKSVANVTINEVAIGKDNDTTLKLYDPDRIGGSSLFPLEWLNKGTCVDVPVMTIDEYCRKQGIRRIDVIKIDIEGAELDAFAGMTTTFEVCQPWLILCEIILSLSSHGGRDSLEIFDVLDTKGYEAREIREVDGLLGNIMRRAVVARLSQNLINVAFIRKGLNKVRPDLFAEEHR